MKRQMATVLLAASLGTVLAQGNPQPPAPIHPVTFKNGHTYQVKAPPATRNSDDFWDQWSFDEAFPSPDGKFMAIRFLQSSKDPRHNPKVIDLVSQSGSQIRLKDSDLLDVSWSLDSKYLLGKGSSSVRVWNTSGILNYRDFSQARRLTIVELKPNRQGLCLALQPSTYAADQAKLSTTVAQVALPGLKIARSSQRSVPVSQQTGFCP
ncbi:hypothetical protein [Deinococcus alpinitundrae]|uniref:hypothetical protein n=1 Tax=Deinococcus alpinitundrae TaxID=468913 RepID=UPI00137B1B21|nr:hypothetical protein [Deinococcus alpinitundrae]